MVKAVDVTKQHKHSDLILKCDGDERVLFVSKTILGMSCDFFEDLFGNQAVEGELQVSFNYDRLKKVMELVHVSPVVGIELDEKTDTDELIELFKTAHQVGCPLVKMATLDLLKDRKNVPTAWALIEILHCGVEVKSTLMEILKTFTVEDLFLALQLDNETIAFSKSDIFDFVERYGRRSESKQSKHKHHQLQRIFPPESLKTNALFDVTRPSAHYRVMLKTEESEEKMLYSNEKILSKASGYFKHFFKNTPEVKAATGKRIAEVPTTYKTMEVILYIVHRLKPTKLLKYYLSTFPHIRRDVLRAAEELQFPLVKQVAIASYFYDPTWVQLMDACKVNIDSSVKVELIETMKPTHVHIWLHSSCKDDDCKEKKNYYFEDGDDKLVTFCTGEVDAPVLNVNELRALLQRMKDGDF